MARGGEREPPGKDGRIDEGELIPKGAAPLPVVGHATGRSVSLLFTTGEGQYLYGAGVAEHDLGQCIGTMGGPFVGPGAGDLGDWLICDGDLNPGCSVCQFGYPEPQACSLASCRLGCPAPGLPGRRECLEMCNTTQPFCP